MIKIALCDDNLKSIENISKLMYSVIIELDIDAEIVLVTDNQGKVYEETERILIVAKALNCKKTLSYLD